MEADAVFHEGGVVAHAEEPRHYHELSEGVECRGWGVGVRAWGLGFRVEESGLRTWSTPMEVMRKFEM